MGESSRSRLDPRVGPWFIPALACLAIGGVRSWAVAAIAVLCVLGAVRGRRLRLGLAATLALGALAFQLGQLLPLPMGLLSGIAPATATIVQETATAAGRSAAWHPLSLAPGETAVASAHLALFVLALVLARRETVHGHGELLIQGVVVAAAGVTAVVLLHAVSGLGSIYGVTPARGQGISFVLGPFVSSNHLAVFCCAVLPVVAARTIATSSLASRLNGTALCIALLGIALATLSRTAVLGLAVGLVLLAAMLLAARRLRWREVAIGGLAVALAGATAVAATDGRAYALGDVGFLSDVSSRTALWSVGIDLVREHPVFGVGAGALHSLWWLIRPGPTETAAQDAESVYVQTLVSLGIPATLVLVVGATVVMFFAGREAWRRTQEGDPTAAGAFAALIALLVMDGVTLATTQPGITIVGAWLLGVLADPDRRGRRLPRALVMALGLLIVVLLAWGTPRTLRATDQAFTAGTVDDPVALALRHPADPYGVAWAAQREIRRPEGRGLELLNRAMTLDPHGAEPHRIAVNVLLAAGLRSQARIEARLALTGATRRELPRFVTDALALWPDEVDRLALLPHPVDRAERVALELQRQGGVELARAVWLALGQRVVDPVPGALARAVVLFPPERRDEALSIATAGLRDAPDDIDLLMARARLLSAAGRTQEASDALEAVFDRADLTPRQRAESLYRLGRIHTDDPAMLRALLERPPADNVPERAVRAWMRGRVFEAEGQRSQALRAYAEAVRLRPDVAFYGRALADYRTRAIE